VPLFIPPPVPPAQLGRPREVRRDDGAILRFTTCAEERDDARRLQATTVRYEIVVDGQATTEDRRWVIHWHTQEGFRQLAERAGLRVRSVRAPDGSPATDDADTFVFVLAT
jgi:hypothetical protein